MEKLRLDNRKIRVITEQVCLFFQMQPSEVFSRTNKRECARARQIIHYLCRKHTLKSCSDIGGISKTFGRDEPHDHATVLNSVKVINNLIDTDGGFKDNIKRIELMFASEMNEMTDRQCVEMATIERNYLLKDALLNKNKTIFNLEQKILSLNKNVKHSTNNKDLQELLKKDKEIIDMFCETRLKPFLKMLESRVVSDKRPMKRIY